MVHSSWIILFFFLGVAFGVLIGFGVATYFYEHY